MKPHPRIRKTIKWGGAVVTVLLVVVWVGSAWVYVRHVSAHWEVALFPGRLMLLHSIFVDDPEPLGWYVGSRSRWPEWGWWLSREGNSLAKSVYVPVWPLAATALLITIAAWRLDTLARRRARLNRRRKCNYDWTGLAVGAVCPECGGRST